MCELSSMNKVPEVTLMFGTSSELGSNFSEMIHRVIDLLELLLNLVPFKKELAQPLPFAFTLLYLKGRTFGGTTSRAS